MNHLERACESIDASIFSSDMLFNDEQRAMLKGYLGRWNRAIYQHSCPCCTELSRVLDDLVGITDAAMLDANERGSNWDPLGELEEARDILARPPAAPRTESQERADFEAWISELPYERSTTRWSTDNKDPLVTWPGQYMDSAVQLAWAAWQAARRGVQR